jgi:hypothetical protein
VFDIRFNRVKLLSLDIEGFIKYLDADFAIDYYIKFVTLVALLKNSRILIGKLVLKGLGYENAVLTRDLALLEKLDFLDHWHDRIKLALCPAGCILD